jgi:hypothetical protein
VSRTGRKSGPCPRLQGKRLVRIRLSQRQNDQRLRDAVSACRPPECTRANLGRSARRGVRRGRTCLSWLVNASHELLFRTLAPRISDYCSESLTLHDDPLGRDIRHVATTSVVRMLCNLTGGSPLRRVSGGLSTTGTTQFVPGLVINFQKRKHQRLSWFRESRC